VTTRYLAALAALISFSLGATAQAQSFPNRPVRIVVPLAPGGGMDTVTRGVAQKLSEQFGQTVVVDNRPGAGSQIALEITSSAAPDGHTLLMISATTVTHPLLYKSRFDVARDFLPVSQVTQQGYVLVIHPSIPAKNVVELVQYLRANPNKVNYASSGIGSPIHMSTELFQVATGTRMTHIPFKGMGAAYGDMIAGRIQLSFATIISFGDLLAASGRQWRPLAFLARTPPFSWIASLAYRWIARNRHRLPGGTPACSMPPHLRPGAGSDTAPRNHT